MTSNQKISNIIQQQTEQFKLNFNPFWNKNKTEIYRKAIHISSILIPFTYLYLVNKFGSSDGTKIAILILSGCAIISFVVEILRLENINFRKYFRLIFGIMLRKHERDDFTGASYLLTSAIICVSFFPAEIAFLAMAFLSIGDTFAALVGRNFGRRKFKNSQKSYEGFLACFITTFTFGVLILSPEWYPVVMVGAIAASVAEAVNIPIDDNVKIPIISGVAMIIPYLLGAGT